MWVSAGTCAPMLVDIRGAGTWFQALDVHNQGVVGYRAVVSMVVDAVLLHRMETMTDRFFEVKLGNHAMRCCCDHTCSLKPAAGIDLSLPGNGNRCQVSSSRCI